LKLSSQITHDIHDSEPPPILGTWARVNIAVLCWLAFLILLAWAFTEYFSA